MLKRQVHAWQLWLSKCSPKRKHLWKIKVNTWPLSKKQLFADYVYIKYMGGYLKFNLWRFLFFYGHLSLTYLQTIFSSYK